MEQKGEQMRLPRNKFIKIAVVFTCFVGSIVVSRLWYLEEQGNFHAITPEVAYRSAQLDRDELEYYLNKFNIRSVINLRGQKESAQWFKEEVATCQDLGVRHYNLRLRADKRPSSQMIEELLRLYRTAPRPILIHCKAGADRSGLAAALWKVVIDKAPKTVAKAQLSIRYGHIPIGPTQAMDAFFERWAPPTKTSIDAAEMTEGFFKRSADADS